MIVSPLSKGAGGIYALIDLECMLNERHANTMKKTAKKLKLFISIEFQRFTQYRGDVVVYTLTSFVLPIVLLNIWLSMAESKGSAFGDKSYVVQYFFVQIIVNILISTWHAEYFGRRINTGEISSFLLKPFAYIWFLVADNLSEKIWKVFFSLPVLVVLGYIYRDYLHIPIAQTLLPGMIAIIVAGAIKFMNAQLMGIAAFWISDNRGLIELYEVVSYLTSGRVFPLRYATKVIPALIINALPFQYMLGFPIDVIIGRQIGNAVVIGITIQCVWLGAYIVAHQILWKKGLQTYGGYGG